ncbi:MAG: hypothetical protein AAGD25_08085 [Cyanobacteria bacterium P01_F01_bin.150]
MRDFESVVSVCRHCQSYTLEGRRGGHCSQLGSLMKGDWKACPLAIPAFSPSWESQSGIKYELAQLIREQRQQLEMLNPRQDDRDPVEVLEACINTPDPPDPQTPRPPDPQTRVKSLG